MRGMIRTMARDVLKWYPPDTRIVLLQWQPSLSRLNKLTLTKPMHPEILLAMTEKPFITPRGSYSILVEDELVNMSDVRGAAIVFTPAEEGQWPYGFGTVEVS